MPSREAVALNFTSTRREWIEESNSLQDEIVFECDYFSVDGELNSFLVRRLMASTDQDVNQMV
jgi:hypothetical protein